MKVSPQYVDLEEDSFKWFVKISQGIKNSEENEDYDDKEHLSINIPHINN